MTSAKTPQTAPPPCSSTEQTFFYGVQLTVIPGVGGQVSAGNYISNNNAHGSYVSGGGGGGFNLGLDAFVGVINGGPKVLAGRTDAVTIGLLGVSLNLIFKPDASFTPSNYLGFAVGPGADFGLSVSKDNTKLFPAAPNNCRNPAPAAPH
jgi:hypothetical protein